MLKCGTRLARGHLWDCAKVDAYLTLLPPQGDATDSQNLIYTDTLMGDPTTVDSSGRHVTFKLRSQMTRKLNSYDWDIANRTESFSDAPLVISAEYDTTDKSMVSF